MKIKSGMRVVVIIFLIGSFLLTSCADAGTPVLDSTLEVSQSPVLTATTSPTATNTPEPGPSTANLPEEWKDMIDRVEVMTDMEGNERTVAIERSGDPDKESRLRVLQWDEAGKEWEAYEPQVGLIGTKAEYWDKDVGGGYSTQADELSGTELQKMSAEPIYGRDGLEISPGLVAEFAEVTLFCGDVIESKILEGGILVVIKITLPTGDIELFRITEGVGGDQLISGYLQESIDPVEYRDPARFGSESIADHLTRISQPITTRQVFEYFSSRSASLPWRVVFGVQNTPSIIKSGDVPGSRQRLPDRFSLGEVFDQEGVGINFFNYPLFSEESLKTIR